MESLSIDKNVRKMCMGPDLCEDGDRDKNSSSYLRAFIKCEGNVQWSVPKNQRVLFRTRPPGTAPHAALRSFRSRNVVFRIYAADKSTSDLEDITY